MPYKLDWLAQATDDLDELLDYIATHDRRAAHAYVQGIIKACEKLKSFPEAGRVYNDLYRVVVVRNHLVLYRFDPNIRRVIIAAVVDGRRDVKALLDDGEE